MVDIKGEPVYVGNEAETDDEADQPPSPAAFRMGIIDILVRYTTKKKLAHALKKPTLGCCLGQEIDTEPPDYYQTRFSDAMTKKLKQFEHCSILINRWRKPSGASFLVGSM